MLTRWGRDLDPDAVLPEHPRPQLVREGWASLNGYWDYAIRPSTSDTPRYEDRPPTRDGLILVPFSPEAPLSGVQRHLQPDETLWYHLDLEVPDAVRPRVHADDRLLLHAGAVDQSCWVWLDGVLVGEHHGGYLPFSADLTVATAAGGTCSLVVAVRDPSETSWGARGKQKLGRGEIWYTAQSGIWQSVWLERVPTPHVRRLVTTPGVRRGAGGEVAAAWVDVTIEAETSTGGHVRLLADGEQVAAADAAPGRPVRLDVPHARLWSPDDPYMHDLVVTLGEDEVRSSVGLRTTGVGHDERGLPRFLLNGVPSFQAGVLDQGYWPDGLYTAPSDAAMVADLEVVKQMGFTMVRKHAKVEPLRWYHHCDRLGLLVWQDAVNGGHPYRTEVIDKPRRWRHHRDDRIAATPGRRRPGALFGRADAAGRRAFAAEVVATVELLRSATCVVCWVPFNEGWGQFEAAEAAARLHELDPTRPVDHASGWHDQGAGDVRSVHEYLAPFVAPEPDGRVLALTEYGGFQTALLGHTWSHRRHGYRRVGSLSALRDAFERLHLDEVLPAVPQGLSATVWTQLTDVEDEVNGLVTYDRERLKIPTEDVARVLARLCLPDAGRPPLENSGTPGS